MAEFTKKVEILRALVRTQDQFKKEFGDIEDVPFAEEARSDAPGGVFEGTRIKDIDLQIMGEFKKVFSLGYDRLLKFIEDLDKASPTGEERGKAKEKVLDVYSVLYYVDCLLRGPYAQTLENLRAVQRLPDVFNAAPDVMGINASPADSANSSTPVFAGVAADLPGVTLGKSPSILVKLLQAGKGGAQGIFNSNIGSAVYTDNTVLWGDGGIDKENELRVEQEAEKGRSKLNPAHGNHMVKDREKIDLVKDAVESINKSIEEFLGEKPYQIFLFNRGVNYFNKKINKAESVNESIGRNFDFMLQKFEDTKTKTGKSDGVGQEILKLQETTVDADMFGQPFDSILRRDFRFRTTNNEGENVFKLYSVQGQLGSGDEPKSEPMPLPEENL
jgi:hypothetical protein